MVWINLHTIQRRADLFPDPDAFIPERFLLGEDMWPPQKEIRKDSFRPFEKGPRACIGQELAMLEMKIIMVMTCRDFDVKIDYTEWERKMGREKPGDDLGGKRTMFGKSIEEHEQTPGSANNARRPPRLSTDESRCETCRWPASQSIQKEQYNSSSMIERGR